MTSFDYYNPTRIVFGQGRLAEIERLIPKDAKVMLVYGGSSARKSGLVERARHYLGPRDVIECGGILPNPELEPLVSVASLARAENVDFLLAIGGGSVMDATKFISLAVNYETDPGEILGYGYGGVPAVKAIPLGCVVTLPATGSEMNMGGVITSNGEKLLFMSPLVFPQFSILDPILTQGLPAEQVANGIADAFVHVTEQYLTYPVDAKVQDRMAEGLLRTLIEDGPVTLADNSNLQARENVMWAAATALCGIVGAGVPQDWSTHMIGHQLTKFHGIAHGRTLAIILPHLLRERREQKKVKLLQYAERVWNIVDGDKDQRIDRAIDQTENFFNSLGIATRLSQYGVGLQARQDILANLELTGMTALSETGDLGLDSVARILQTAE